MNNCNHLLSAEKGLCAGVFEWENGKLRHSQITQAHLPETDFPQAFLAEGLPLEFHCHGMGAFDFSAFDAQQLVNINDYLREIGVYCVLTGFLPIEKITAFASFMRAFGEEKSRGGFSHIVGVALEGPLLSSVGGTPQKGTWAPDKVQWQQLVKNAGGNMPYIVISPDALLPGGVFSESVAQPGFPDLEWIVELFFDHGIRPSLGHFQKHDPQTSLASIHRILRIVEQRGAAMARGAVFTDHLFNDMPLNFKHAWRTPAEKAARETDLQNANLASWHFDNLEEKMGLVPAAILKGARDGIIVPSLNFDGDHVDHAVCRRVVELVGADCIIAMTDNAAISRQLCGRVLNRKPFNTLLYQEEDVVAAGTQNIQCQAGNLRKLGFSEPQIWQMISFLPQQMLLPEGKAKHYTYVAEGENQFTITI